MGLSGRCTQSTVADGARNHSAVSMNAFYTAMQLYRKYDNGVVDRANVTRNCFSLD